MNAQSLQSIIERGLNWIIEYAVEINSLVSLFLTISIIYIYLRQHNLLKDQTESMKNQTKAMRAGIKPILLIDDNIDYLNGHPHKDRQFANPKYINIEISNVGNEVANNVILLTKLQWDIDLPEIEMITNKQPLKSQSNSVVVREKEGGTIASNQSDSFYGAVEIRFRHPELENRSYRIGNAINTLISLYEKNNEGTELDSNPCLAFAIQYENLAEEPTVIPIKKGIEIDINSNHSNFEEVFENRTGHCETNGVFN